MSKHRKTEVSIQGDAFYINGKPTYAGRTWQGHKIEGLLMNSRMVQGIFDDLNPESRSMFAYPDTGVWDPERNTHEFIENMPVWRSYGLLAFTINLQGGSPQGYSKEQPWVNSAVTPDGALRPDYMARLERILDKADDLGMVVILGIFYFGQEKHLNGPDAIRKAVDHTMEWLLDKGYRNVIIEVDNESNVIYKQPLLLPEGVHELIEQAKAHTKDDRRLLVGTSFGGGYIPPSNVVKVSDFLLLHGNGVHDPKGIIEQIHKTRQVQGYRPMPVLYNEDDHFDFDKPLNNMVAAIQEYVGWGFFDYRMTANTNDKAFRTAVVSENGEGFDDGYQSVPVNWGISSVRKKAFFKFLKEVTGE